MRKPKEGYFDGEVLFKKYFEMGQAASLNTLAHFAVAQGMTKVVYTNKTKLPKMGVWKAMWRWASLKEHRAEAFQIFKEYVYKYGWILDSDYPWDVGIEVTEQEWNHFMIKKIIRSAFQYPEKRYQRFLKENGWT